MLFAGENDEVWYGDQDLACMMGIRSLPSWVPAVNHRLLYYCGRYYEFGIGEPRPALWRIAANYEIDAFRARHSNTYPASPCEIIKWTYKGTSNMHFSDANKFTDNYIGDSGKYRFLTNNCYHFAQKLCTLLTGSHCTMEMAF